MNLSRARSLRREIWTAFIFALILPELAQAATRTVSFMGVIQNRPNTSEVANSSGSAVCSVILTNLGSNAQRLVSIQISRFIVDSNGSTKFLTLSSASNEGLQYVAGSKPGIGTELIGSAGPKPSCFNQDLQQGDVCMIQYLVDSLNWSGKIGYCSGSLTVRDVDTSKPGSMIAGGSIFLNQETMVLGGILSGAYYASQTHVQSTDFSSGNLADDSVGDFTGTYRQTYFGNIGSQNMNVFCQAACRAGNTSWSQQDCEEMCGIGDRSGATDGWTYHVSGFDRQIVTSTNGATTITGGSTISPSTISPNTSSSQLYNGSSDYSTQHSVANTHFAGGMVYEMVIGGFTGVCSGNHQFFEDGGTDFVHADGVDTHAWYYTNDSKYPPERLVCSHRHSRSDLFMRTGSTSPILVNGGSPF